MTCRVFKYMRVIPAFATVHRLRSQDVRPCSAHYHAAFLDRLSSVLNDCSSGYSCLALDLSYSSATPLYPHHHSQRPPGGGRNQGICGAGGVLKRPPLCTRFCDKIFGVNCQLRYALPCCRAPRCLDLGRVGATSGSVLHATTCVALHATLCTRGLPERAGGSEVVLTYIDRTNSATLAQGGQRCY